jgi:phosphatidylglycerol:prolipoprotein diacylglycerol transferase
MATLIPWFEAGPLRIPLPSAVPFVGDELAIHPFGLLAVTGILIGARTARAFAARHGISEAQVADLASHVIACALAGAMLLNAAFYHPSWFVRVWSEPSFPGLSSFGGYTGAVAGLLLWKLRRRTSALGPAGALAYAFPFAWIPCRTGCFLAHDHPGIESRFWLAVDDYAGLGAPRHDLGLYEALWAVAAAVTFFAIERSGRRPPGFYLALLPLLYAPVRFGLDFLRADPSFPGGDVRYAGLTPGHYGSIVLLIAGVLVLVAVKRSRPR